MLPIIKLLLDPGYRTQSKSVSDNESADDLPYDRLFQENSKREN